MKIQIELTPDQGRILSRLTSHFRSNPEEVAKAYLLEGIQILTEPGKSDADILCSGLEILSDYIELDGVPESVFGSPKREPSSVH